MKVTEDVTYATVDGVKLKLDIYQPRTQDRRLRRIAVHIHGGGWQGGDKEAVSSRSVIVEVARKAPGSMGSPMKLMMPSNGSEPGPKKSAGIGGTGVAPPNSTYVPSSLVTQ